MKKVLSILIICTIFATAGMLCISAETTAYDETYAVESFIEETEATEYTEDTTAQITDPVESGITETEPEQQTETQETRPKPTYPESLPEISSSDIIIPDVIGDIKEDNEPALFWGFVAWICIGVGVAVILAVLLTTKTKAYRGGGKKRYSTGDKISGQKRLLNDKYYNSKRK